MCHRLVSGKQKKFGIECFLPRANTPCMRGADVLGLVPPHKESGHTTAEDDSLSRSHITPPPPKSSERFALFFVHPLCCEARHFCAEVQ